MAAYRWSENAGRFTDARGRFVAEKTVRSVIDKIADGASDRMEAATNRMLNGELSLSAWTTEMQGHIRLAHGASAIIAHGGAEQMTQARWGSVGRVVRDEYRYLREFSRQIESGEQKLNGTVAARARQYGQGAKVAYSRVVDRRQREQGAQAERNVMGRAEHCQQCRNLAAKGWVPIGTLPRIGSRTCRANDACRIEYRDEVA